MPTSVSLNREDTRMDRLIMKVKKKFSTSKDRMSTSTNEVVKSAMDSELCNHSNIIPNKSRKRKLEDMLNTTKHEENNLQTNIIYCGDISVTKCPKNDAGEVTSKSKKRRLRKKKTLNKSLQRLLNKKSKHKQLKQTLNSEGDSECSSKEEVNPESPKPEKCIISKLFTKSKKSKGRKRSYETTSKTKDNSYTVENINSQSLLPCVALDCEMVGVGPGKKSALGRCSIVSSDGSVIYDSYVKPEQTITDFRTRWSGIRKYHMAKAVSFNTAHETVKNIIKDKIVVGHAVHNDFKVLDIKHPRELVRDTSKCQTLKEMANQYTRQAVSLKNLSYALLGKRIQDGSHCSVEDARATMDLFQMVKDKWENKNSKPVLVNDSISDSYLDDDYWPQDVCDH